MHENLVYRSHDGDGSNRPDDNEDEEEDVDETGYKTVKDAVLFAIEASDSMLKAPPSTSSKKADTNSPLLAALKCAYHFMQQRIISNPKDLMGILIYGTEATKFYDETEESRGGYSFPHCYLLTDLNVPEADDVKALKRLVEEDADAERQIFKPAKQPISMSTVLFCANQIFAQKAPNFSSRRLFLVTDNDNPHPNDKALRNSATTRAKDLYDLGVMLELFPISPPSHTFDTKLFYDDIVYRYTPSDPDAIAHNPTSHLDSDRSSLKAGSTEGLTLLQSLLSNVASKATPKRTLFSSVPLELGPNFRISVKGYLLYKRQVPARSCYIYLGSERPQIAKGSTTQVSDETAQAVEKTEIRKAYNFGGEPISFTPEENKELRNFGDPIIRLIGFQPASQLPLWANVKQSTFIYPSEEDYVGSTRVFSALHGKLLKDKLMGLTWFIPRRNAAPVIAALIPTLAAESSESDVDSNPAGVSATGCPQGLHLIPLPFADDLRQNPSSVSEEPIVASDDLVDAMRPMIQQLNLPKGIYDPHKYPNPSLQWHYRILQAIALDEDLPSKAEDKTLPKYRQISKRISNEAAAWQAALEKEVRDFDIHHPSVPTQSSTAAASSSSKRAGTTNANNAPNAAEAGSSNKRIKSEVATGAAAADAGPTDEEVRKLWQKGNVSSLTVAQLRHFCERKKLALLGKKADLVERVEVWCEG